MPEIVIEARNAAISKSMKVRCIEQVKEEWKHGRIILPPADNKEFIPLPDDKPHPAGVPKPEPLS